MDAEYGKHQERCTIVALEGRHAFVRFSDGHTRRVFAKHLPWVPDEAEIAEGAARIRAENIANGQMRPDESRREGPRVLGNRRIKEGRMPLRLEVREGDTVEVGGVPMALAIGRDKRAIFAVAGFTDGLIDSAEDCKAMAGRIRKKIDTGREQRNTSG